MRFRYFAVVFFVAQLSMRGLAADTKSISAPTETPKPVFDQPPTQSNVSYGEHPRQVLDFWKAPSNKPTPVVIYLHGGGWMNGDKNDVSKCPFGELLHAGISVVSVNYRYVWQAQAAHVKPPVSWPMADVARAVQLVRSKAVEWNIDKAHIAGSGGSAGACSILWLALHNDLADPASSDPIARESTRLNCVALNGAQTTLDPREMKDLTPNSRYGGHAFGFSSPKDVNALIAEFEKFLARREEVLPWIKEYSPIEHASADDPPVYLYYKTPPAMGQSEKDPTHSANFGVLLQKKLQGVGVPCELVYPGAPDVKHATMEDYLMEKLTHP